jgi:hypothetical protein
MKTTVEQIIDEFNEELKVAIEIGNSDKIRTIKHLITIAKLHLPKEKEQQKQLVIATYVDLKMKNNKLPYGMEYLNKIAKLEEKAENYYHTEFGGWSISI